MLFGFGGWWRRRFGLRDHTALAVGGTYSGRPVTFDSAMSVPSFFAGVRLEAQTVGTTSISMYKRQGDSRVSYPEHPLYTVLHNAPNPDLIAPDYWEGVVANMILYGNSFSEKLLNGRGDVIGLTLYQSAPQPFSDLWCEARRPRPGAPLEYRVYDRGKSSTLPKDKVFHVRGFGFGGDLGLPILTYARQSLSTAQAADEATGRSFQDGMRTKGFFTFPGLLTPEQREQARKSLIEPFQGLDGQTLGILEADVKFASTNVSAHDAELPALRRLSVEEVCRFLGIPPIMLGHAGEGQTMWGTGVEQLLIQFYTMGLRPIFTRIERQIWQSLIPVREREDVYAEFAIESLLRGDSQARAQFYSTMVNNGLMTRDECRAKENLPKIEGGDIATIQGAMIPLSSLQSPQAVQPARPALRVVQ